MTESPSSSAPSSSSSSSSSLNDILSWSSNMRDDDCDVVVDRETAQTLLRIGRVHVVIGVVCCVSHAVSLKALSKDFYLSTFHISIGFISACLFIVTGFVGTASGTSKTKCKVVVFSVLSAFSAVTCWSLFGFLYFYSELISAGYSQGLHGSTVLVMQLMMLCLVALETIVSVWSAIVSCRIRTTGSPILRQHKDCS